MSRGPEKERPGTVHRVLGDPGDLPWASSGRQFQGPRACQGRDCCAMIGHNQEAPETPNRDTHTMVGVFAGSALAIMQSETQSPSSVRWLEVLGGAIGGYLGGQLPDVLETPTSSWHRSTGHSISAGTGLIVVTRSELTRWQQQLRAWADAVAAERVMYALDSADAFRLTIAEGLCRLLAGLVAGLLAGYISHIALDSLTPRGIRLI